MSDKTGIEWTWTYHPDGTVTKGASWNPIRGTQARHICVKISPGCENCYASDYNERFSDGRYYPDAATVKLTPERRGIPLLVTNGGRIGGGDVEIDTARLDEAILLWPVQWQRGRKIFVCSMTDIAGEWVPDAWIDAMWAVMALAPHHTFQVLTKRPGRLRAWFESDPYDRVLAAADRLVRSRYPKLGDIGISNPVDAAHYPHVWIGVTVESDRYAWRANILRQIPAAVRWISAEPLLSGLPSLDLTGIDWLVSGGESGRRARPMHPGWARTLRDRCAASGTAYFHKQNGEFLDATDTPPGEYPKGGQRESIVITPAGDDLGGGFGGQGMVASDWREQGGAWLVRVGKRNAGRLLDGREWNEMPARQAVAP